MKTKQPSQRQLKVGEEIRHLLSEVIMRQNLRNPLIAGVSITVTEVKISPDLKRAIAFIIPLGGGNIDEVLQGLNKCKKQFNLAMSKNLRLRFMPELKFVYDNRFEEALHIEKLLNQPAVLRDLQNNHKDEAC